MCLQWKEIDRITVAFLITFTFCVLGAGNGIIPPNSVLIFTMILEGLKKELNIEILEEGNCAGDKKVRKKDKITLHYDAKLADGEKESDCLKIRRD